MAARLILHCIWDGLYRGTLITLHGLHGTGWFGFHLVLLYSVHWDLRDRFSRRCHDFPFYSYGFLRMMGYDRYHIFSLWLGWRILF